MRNLRVYLLSLFLILLAIALMTLKIHYGGQNVSMAKGLYFWKVTVQMYLIGSGDKAHAKLTLPQDNPHQTIYNENFDHNISFTVRNHEKTGNRVGLWSSELLDQSESIHYSFSVQTQPLSFAMSPAEEIIENPLEYYPEDMAIWLKASSQIQSDDPMIKKKLKKIIGREKKTAKVIKGIYDFVRTGVQYQSEKGSRDAKLTLEELVADCGGKARLFTALSRAAGIPSRLVGGIILTRGIKNITHVWAENYVGGVWVPFDTVNGHFAAIPKDYLELYRGDYSLMRHKGLSKFEYFFVINREKSPPVDQKWSLYSLPIHFQKMVKVLLLIPVGALVVTLFRVIIGVPTFGTFAPIILAVAFREISLWTGLFCLTLMIALGCMVRNLLDHLKILVIPRISIIVTTVVIMTVVIIGAGYLLGVKKFLYISLFPMIIITWMIERFSVLQAEDGTFAALKSTLGTVAVAITAYFLMENVTLRAYLFTFPELLFAVMGGLLLLGRYTGLRLTELWRFKELHKIYGKKQG